MRDTFGKANDKAGVYLTGYGEQFVAPDLKKITPVKNCKPVHKYKPPSEKMEGASTAHTHFTGESCPPARVVKITQNCTSFFSRIDAVFLIRAKLRT